MTDLLANRLNEVGFQHRGEEVEVTGTKMVTETVTVSEGTSHRDLVPVEREERFVQIELASGETVKMKRTFVDQMIERARQYD